MNSLKKAICILLTLATLGSMSACGDADQEAPEKRTSAPKTTEAPSEKSIAEGYESGGIYYKEHLSLPDADITLYQASRTGETISLYGVDSEQRSVFYQYAPEENTITNLQIVQEHPPMLIGSSWDGSLPILSTDTEGSYIMSIFSGNDEVERLTLPQCDELYSDLIVDILAVENGYIVQTSTQTLILGKNGSMIKALGPCLHAAASFVNDDGTITVARMIQSGPNSSEAKTEIVVLSPLFETLASYQSDGRYTAFYKDSGTGETILAKSTNTVFRYDYKQDSREALIDSYASGMYASKLFSLSSGVYFTIDRSMPAKWTLAQNETQEPIISLAAYNLNLYLDTLVRRFNELNPGRRIQVIDYSIYDQTSGDGTGLNKLRTDIIAGFTPDLYDLTNLPAELYASKGLFEDLLPYLDGSSGVSASEMVPSVLNSLTSDGKLYYVAPSFSIMTVFGDSSFVGEEGTWGTDAFFSAAANEDPKQIFGPEMTSTDFISYMLLYNRAAFVDMENASCNFNDARFKRFLEFASKLPATAESVMSQSWSRASMGEQKLSLNWFGVNVYNWLSYADAVYAGNAQFVGFPSDTSSGSAIVPTALVAVSANTSNKNGAMEFVQFILSESCQDSADVSELPVMMPSLNKKTSAWLANYESAVEQGAVRLNTFYDSTSVKILGTAPPERVQRCLEELISSADIAALFDDTLQQIVLRECQSYFNGMIPIEQAINNIQSKAGLYISEQFG